MQAVWLLHAPGPSTLERSTIRPKDLLPSLPEVKTIVRKTSFSVLAGAIFLVVAVAHALRLAFKWEVIIAGWQVPMWVSAVAFVIAAYLAYEGFQ